MPIFTILISPLLAGLLCLWAAVRLNNPRVGWAESLILALLLGQSVLLAPAAALAPLWVVLGLAAVWPLRALGVLSLALLVALEGWLQGYIVWPALTNFPPAIFGSAALVLTVVIVYQVYHWRWWPPLRHLLIGLSTTTLLLFSAGLGSLPSLTVMGFLLSPLPIWAWWLAKSRQPF